MSEMGTWWLAMFSEFIGTALLILLGNGVVAAVSYKKMAANQSGRFILVVLGWGLAVFVGATVSAGMGGSAWLNPAVAIMQSISASSGSIYSQTPGITAGIAALNGDRSSAIAATFFICVAFELLGAMFGQIILNFMNFKFIKDRENNILTIRGAHCTAPAYRNKEDSATLYNLAYEFIGTAVLLGAILGLNVIVRNGTMSNIGALPVSFVIMSIGISLGSATGYAINPARDLGPRIIFYGLTKKFRRLDFTKEIADWQYSWVPIAAPMAAGLIIGVIGLAA